MIRRWLDPRVLALVVCAALCAPQHAAAQEDKAPLVKAAFIYNFVKFVEWPAEKAVASLRHIDICVMGDDGMLGAKSVFKAASNEKLSLSLVAEENAAKAGHCHVLYIGAGVGVAEVLSALKDSPVLTVSDAPGFVDKGGMIGFVMNDNKIKLEVNTKAASQAGLRVDAQLLEIALRVVDR